NRVARLTEVFRGKVMQMLLLMLLLIAGLCAGQQSPKALEAKGKSQLDVRVRGLEEQLKNQQFEINQLKKELLARDEELHALTQMIEGEGEDPNATDNAQQNNDDTFQPENDACPTTRFVHLRRPVYGPGRVKQISVTNIH